MSYHNLTFGSSLIHADVDLILVIDSMTLTNNEKMSDSYVHRNIPLNLFIYLLFT